MPHDSCALSDLMPRTSTQILIVDDHAVLARALGAWLSLQPSFKVVGYATDGRQGWQLCAALRPDLAMVDVQMDECDGLLMAARIKKELPATRVVVLTGLLTPYIAHRVLEIGADGLLDKLMAPRLFREAIRTVAAGGAVVSPAFQAIREKQLASAEAFHKVLSPREQAIVQHVSRGRSDTDIGTQLGITPDTVAAHRRNTRLKLGLHNDRELLAYAREWGL